MEWNIIPIQRSDFERVEILPEKPKCFNQICEAAKTIARGKRFVRIDFYVINEKPFFSEFTLYPTSGLIKFSPESGDEEFGRLLELLVRYEYT